MPKQMGIKTGFLQYTIMGLFDKVSGLFSEKEKEIGFLDARAMVESEFEKENNIFSDTVSKKYSEIKYLLGNLGKSAVGLESHEINLDEGNKRYRRIIITSQKNLAQQLKGLSSKLTPPAETDFETVSAYSKKSFDAITRDLLPYWKNIALAKLMLKDEIRSVGENIEELSETFKNLGTGPMAQKMASLLRAKKAFEDFDSRTRNQKNAEVVLKEAELKAKEIQLKIREVKQELEKKKNSPEAKEYNLLFSEQSEKQGEKNDAVASFNSEIAPAEKVLKRLLVLSGGNSLLDDKEKSVLRAMLDNPASATIIDPNGGISKKVLEVAKKMIIDGSISLKDKEKEKRLMVIGMLLEKDFYSDFFWKINKAEADLQAVNKKISIQNITGKIKNIENRIDSHSREFEEREKEADKARKESIKIKGFIEESRKRTGEIFKSVFAGKYKIKF